MIGEFCPKVFALKSHPTPGDAAVGSSIHADASAGIGIPQGISL